MAREIPVDPAHLARRAAAGGALPGPDRDRIVDAVEDLPEMDRAVVECLVWGGMTSSSTKLSTSNAPGSMTVRPARSVT